MCVNVCEHVLRFIYFIILVTDYYVHVHVFNEVRDRDISEIHAPIANGHGHEELTFNY